VKSKHFVKNKTKQNKKKTPWYFLPEIELRTSDFSCQSSDHWVLAKKKKFYLRVLTMWLM